MEFYEILLNITKKPELLIGGLVTIFTAISGINFLISNMCRPPFLHIRSYSNYINDQEAAGLKEAAYRHGLKILIRNGYISRRRLRTDYEGFLTQEGARLIFERIKNTEDVTETSEELLIYRPFYRMRNGFERRNTKYIKNNPIRFQEKGSDLVTDQYGKPIDDLRK